MFNKARQTTEMSKIVEAQELLQQKVYEVQIIKAGNATLQDFVDYLGKDKERSYVILLPPIASVSGDVTLGEIDEIYVVYNDYTFLINSKFNINYVEKAVVNSKIEATYEVINEIDENNYKVLINVNNNVGIQKIICPNGNEIVANNKKNISIDYDIQEDNLYEFKIIVEDKEEVWKLDSYKMDNIKIEQNKSYAYPVLTKDMVDINKNIEIDFQDGTNNYYSVDQGKTWIEYNGVIKIDSECTVFAKTFIENEITKIYKKNITLEMAEDAIGPYAYDNSLDTSTFGTYKYIKLDDSVKNKTVKILISCPGSNHIYAKMLKEDKATVTGEVKYWHTNYGLGYIYLIVPEDAVWIKIDEVEKNYAYKSEIYDIRMEDIPIGDETSLHPHINKDGLYNEKKFKIKYCETAIEKLYSYDKVNWIKYPEEGVKLNYEQIIYAKSINSKGIESSVLSYTLTTKILGDEAFDEDIESFSSLDFREKYTIFIDLLTEDLNMNIKFMANVYSRWRFDFYDANENKVGNSFDAVNGMYEGIFDIPKEVVKMEIYYIEGSGSSGDFYNISINK